MAEIINKETLDIERRNKMVEDNMNLAYFFANKYNFAGVERDALINMAAMGLMRAAELFDESRGFQFSTYASGWIKHFIMKGIASETQTIHIPSKKYELINKINNVRKEIFKKTGEEATMDQIVEMTGVSEKEIEKVIDLTFDIFSINNTIGDDDGTFEDVVADQNSVDPLNTIIENEREAAVQYALSTLSEKEERVLRLRFGFDDRPSMTLQEIADLPEFNVSRERIRQVESKALRKLYQSPRLRELLWEYVS